MKFFLLSTLILLLSGMAQAEEPIGAVSPRPRVELRIAKQDGVRVGDLLDAELDSENLPPGAKLRSGGGLAQGYFVSDSGRLGVLKAGVVQVPAIEVVDAAGNVIAETGPTEIQVASALKDQASSDGKPPEPEPPAGPQRLGLPLGLQAGVGIVFFSLLVFLTYRLIRWIQARLRRTRNLPRTPQSADQIALRRLNLVELEKWYEKGNAKRHFFEISEALKAYFSDRFTIDARESTTTELMERLTQLRDQGKVTPDQLHAIQNCFSVLDLVKFTDYRPETSESLAQLDEARRIVVRTKDTSIAQLTPDSVDGPRLGVKS